MTLPPHIQSAPAPAAANVTWTLMPPPHVAFQMWVDGSIKVVFAPSHAEEVITCLEQHLNAFKIAKGMLENPPKTCPGCRGKGQIVVKKGDAKTEEVCPKCKGSGKMNFVPPNLSPIKAPVATVGHEPGQRLPDTSIGITLPSLDDDEPPKVELPHQTLPQVPDPDALRQVQLLLKGMGYKVVALTKEETAAQLEQTTKSAEHTETDRPPAEVEPDSKPVLSLEELAAIGKTP